MLLSCALLSYSTSYKKHQTHRTPMKTLAIKLIKNSLKYFDIGITRYEQLQQLRNNASALDEIRAFFKTNEGRQLIQHLLPHIGNSRSQLGQDLFVLSHLAFKRNGYFVEFGATNGIDLSNTYLLEKEFGWNGILAEPAKVWHEHLKRNRNCDLETDCVWKDSGSTLTFNQAAEAELSTISAYSGSDGQKESRRKGEAYEVRTISLNDLLVKYKAPKHIDYLSIDTEGSEYEILSNFDFSRHSFGVITCEHNYTPMRDKLYSLLTQQGYQRVLTGFSCWDDWYVKPAPPQPAQPQSSDWSWLHNRSTSHTSK